VLPGLPLRAPTFHCRGLGAKLASGQRARLFWRAVRRMGPPSVEAFMRLSEQPSTLQFVFMTKVALMALTLRFRDPSCEQVME
jgi:hypothetical protein